MGFVGKKQGFPFVLILGAIFVLFAFSLSPALGFEGIADRFFESDPNSKVRVNHDPLSDYLQATVFPVGRSHAILGNERPDHYRGSRIRVTKSFSPSRFEGSRVFIHAFSEEHKFFFSAYQEGLERLSNRRPLKTLNKNEQLAYWLNLYNVIVINKLIEDYPISNLKSWGRKKTGKKSFWHEKITTVEGVPLSLADIEAILFSNFDSPLVVFGLWQGSIGGPRLLNFGFNGRNVWQALERNAVEFVNSNRGLRPPQRGKMGVSEFYRWTLPAFGSEAKVLDFVKQYVDPDFIEGVSEVTELDFKIYDWAVADILGGTRHSGQYNQVAGALNFGGYELSPPFPIRGQNLSPGFDLVGEFQTLLRKQNVEGLKEVPLEALETVLGILQNTHPPIPIISPEMCKVEEVCEIEFINFDELKKQDEENFL